jgi:hypothetical protein
MFRILATLWSARRSVARPFASGGRHGGSIERHAEGRVRARLRKEGYDGRPPVGNGRAQNRPAGAGPSDRANQDRIRGRLEAGAGQHHPGRAEGRSRG